MLPFDAGPEYVLGRYITEVTCAECHGPKLEGHPMGGVRPTSIVASGYTRAEFETLLTKGILPNGRKFKNPLMGRGREEPVLTFHAARARRALCVSQGSRGARALA